MTDLNRLLAEYTSTKIGKTRVGDYLVSTVRLPNAYGIYGANPYETLVFAEVGGSEDVADEFGGRAATEDDARELHADVVGRVRARLDAAEESRWTDPTTARDRAIEVDPPTMDEALALVDRVAGVGSPGDVLATEVRRLRALAGAPTADVADDRRSLDGDTTEEER